MLKKYEVNGIESGGRFSRAELLIELKRRRPSTSNGREVTAFIVQTARNSDDGLITYGEVWDRFFDSQPWQGNHSGREVGALLDNSIAYCVRHNLPIVTTLVVQKGARCMTPEAESNIYTEAKSWGVDVGLSPHDFVVLQTNKSRELAVDNLPAGD